MPRKAKENKEIKDKKISTVKTNKKNEVLTSDTNNTPVAKKKSTVKNNSVKKSTTKKKNTSSKTKTSQVKSKVNKRSTKKIADKAEKKEPIVEYYDLPYKYNKTVVKVLAQTPKTLFVYWEISDYDIENYKKQFGDNFFETTKPVLKVYNDTLNYSFEVDINDFANSWYLHVNDSKSDYRIELGRRPIQYNEKIKSDYIYISSSNEIESPNDHILFNNSQKMVYFRNIKTNVETSKSILTLSFMKNIGKIYDIYDLYKELYKNEDSLEKISNPSSNTSSQFK